MTHGAEDQYNRSNAGLPGSLSWQLTMSDVVSLAINVVQNEWDYRELRPDLRHLTGASAASLRRRRRDAPASDTTRMMLEQVYREVLRANRREAARALAQRR